MGKYRKLPFGYRMELGRIVVHPDEKPWVEYIFQQYALGASFLELAEYMAEEGIQYEAGKLWNKNIIARMLGDIRYIGERGFPTIVATETLDRVKERRESKQTTASKTEAQKALRRKCGCRVTPRIEQEVLYLLNSLAEHSERITMPQQTVQVSHQQDRLMKELDAQLQASPINNERAEAVIMELAAITYEAVVPEEYETYRMRQVFQHEQPRSELDARLINDNIQSIQVDSRRKVRLILKNGQMIERGEHR